ncbi:unnamed protein product [Moneuplotes crassus]|uniref:Uncharacterized protein n=1 Tax=Euplotes crassus TaxID=5936 RepID=A0AAD1XSQ6_EUPCR|nr:unnamed protein product [Moneuplotes crassus]
MEAIVNAIEHKNLEQARAKTITDLVKLYGDLRVHEEGIKRLKSKHTIDFTDIVKVRKQGDPEGGREEVENGLEEGKEGGSGGKKGDTRSLGLFGGIGKSDTGKSSLFGQLQKGNKVVKSLSLDEVNKKFMISVLNNTQKIGCSITPSLEELAKKNVEWLKRVPKFTVYNKHQSVEYIDPLNLMELMSNDFFRLVEPDLKSHCLGVYPECFFTKHKAKVTIPNLSKGEISGLEERVRHSQAWIEFINPRFNVERINYDKASDTLTYQVTNFKKKGSF